MNTHTGASLARAIALIAALAATGTCTALSNSSQQQADRARQERQAEARREEARQEEARLEESRRQEERLEEARQAKMRRFANREKLERLEEEAQARAYGDATRMEAAFAARRLKRQCLVHKQRVERETGHEVSTPYCTRLINDFGTAGAPSSQSACC